MIEPRVQTYDDMAVFTPDSLGDAVRVMTPWPDDAREPVAALCAFEPRSRQFTAITSPATPDGLAALARAVPEHIPGKALVIVAVRLASPPGPHHPGPRTAEPPGDVDPGSGLAEPRSVVPRGVVPRGVDLAFPATVRDTLGPLIQATGTASHLDTVLVTEQSWWSIHCTRTCQACRTVECLPVPSPTRRTGRAAPSSTTPSGMTSGMTSGTAP